MKQWNKIYKNKLTKYKYYDVLEPHEDMPFIAEIFEENDVKKVLDLGCGAGRNLLYLANAGFEMYGIDIAEEGVKVLDTRLADSGLKADLRVGNILDPLPYPDNFFDAVISIQVMQHGTEKQILKTILELKRIIKPNGLILVTLCGRIANGHIRYCLVKTAQLIAPHTYKPTIGDEIGLTHYIYDKKRLLDHYRDFQMLKFWKDQRDYYCFLGRK
jgi:SAM-dependent methyltransferase